MMASPASTAGFSLKDERDPWDWSIEEVVAVLCSAEHAIFPEPIAFAKAIREHRLCGGALLVEVTHTTLRDNLGVKAMGEQFSVLKLIQNLRIRSAKYRQHILEASSLNALNHAGMSTAFPYPGNFPAAQFNLPLMRYLTEPIELPRNREASRLPIGPPVNTAQVDASFFQTEEPRVSNPSPPEDKFDESYSPPPVLDNNSEADHGQAPELPPRSKSSSSTPTNKNLPGHRSSFGGEDERILRAGEMYVVDESGRKRRKLWLGAPETTRNDPVVVNEASGEVDSNLSGRDPELSVDFTQFEHKGQLLTIDPSIQVDGIQRVEGGASTVVGLNGSTSTNILLLSSEAVNTIQEISDTAEDLAAEVDKTPILVPLSPEAFSAPTDHDVSAAGILRPAKKIGSARPDHQSKPSGEVIQEQEDSVWQPDIMDETGPAYDGDGANGIRPASPDNSAALKVILTNATDRLNHSNAVETLSSHEQLGRVETPNKIPSKSGVVVVDSQGRKRLIPTLIVQPSVGQPDERAPSPVPSIQVENAEDLLRTLTRENNHEQADTVPSTSSNIRKREPSEMYLGLGALPVDMIFYGGTAMGRKITYQDSYHAIAPVGMGSDSIENWVLLSDNLFPNGQRLYVNERIKYFLSSKPLLLGSPKLLPRQYGVVPYPARILKKHLPLSLTLFSSSAADDGAKRVRRPSWLADNGVTQSIKTSQDQSDGVYTFDVPQDSSLLSHLGENEVRDFDFLEKWNHQENGQEVLPLYGESGSEAEYDLDTWQEMEKEQSKKLERPLGKSRKKRLMADAVSEIIEESIEQMVEEWKIKQLPLRAHKAWRLWAKSRRDNSRQHQIASSVKSITTLEWRLKKLKKELQGEDWTNAMQLKKQCRCMQLTINDLEASKWTISILQLKQAPPKPETPTNKRTSKNRTVVESIPDGEEELRSSESADESSGTDLDGFIVEDDMMSDDKHDNESVGISLDDDKDVSAQISSDNVVHGNDPLNCGDEILDYGEDITTNDDTTYDSDIICTSPLKTPSESPIRLYSLSPLPSLDDLITEEPTTPGNLLRGITGKQNSSETTSGLEVDNTKISTEKEVTLNDVIDLTQLSDTDTSEALTSPMPKMKEESYRVCTPPKDDADPFKRARKAKNEFREPPTVSHIIDLEGEEQWQDQEMKQWQDQEVPSPSKQQLPGLWELSKIGDLKWELLAERHDRKRLLTWIMLHTPSKALKDVLTVTQYQSSAEIQPTIWAGLRAIRGNATEIRHKNSSGIMQVASWYISWHNCKVFPEPSGIPLSYVESTMENQTGFEECYNFMLETFSKLEADKLSKPSTSSTLGPFKKKRQVRLDEDPEPRSTPRKKRKRVLQESQEAAELVSNAQERARERIERQKLLQKQLERSGMDMGEASAKIVNGKSGEGMITINPQIGRKIQQHQLEGIQFMWGEVVSDQAEMQGCLLAHTMGLGKTMQIITLLTTLADASNNPSEAIRNQIPDRLRESCTLVLCPAGLVENWWDEFLLWVPAESWGRIGDIRKISAKLPAKDRVYEITKWSENGGILLIGYTLFKSLVINKVKLKSDEKSRGVSDEEYEKISKILVERPNIVVADEAHAAKKASSNLSQAIAMIRSRSRIALTGSPLANNLEEYYSIIDWIAPGYLSSRTDFLEKYVEPINEGLFVDATQSKQREGLKMLEVLKEELAPKVHRLDISVLKNLLPPKIEFVLRLPLTDLQHQAYSIYAGHMLNTSTGNEPGSARLWAWLAVLVLLCNHPSCFLNKLNQKQTHSNPTKKGSDPLLSAVSEATDPLVVEESADLLLEGSISNLGIPETMVEQQISLFKKVPVGMEAVELSYKMQMLFHILRLSIAVGDKVLVFSHSLPTLDYIEELLIKAGYNYARLDGRTKMQTRQQLTKDFNKNMDVCLISTRAGGQGLNLAGANRVVIMDSHFNPMHEEQAIGRAYRIGQKKNVYVYRLIVGGTFEQSLLDQSLFKMQLATRVVDKKNPVRHALKGTRQYLFPPKHIDQMDLKEFEGKDAAVLGKILVQQASKPMIRSIALTETFHEEVYEPLTAQEEKEKAAIREREQLRRTDPVAYNQMIQRQQTMPSIGPPMPPTDLTVPAPGPTTHVKGPAINPEQFLERRLGQETGAPRRFMVATTMSRVNGSEVDRRMPLPILDPTVQISSSVETSTDPQAVSNSGPVRVRAIAHRVTTPTGQASITPSVEPVLGPNTRVEQRSFYESLEDFGSPTIRTPSSVRAESEPVNEHLPKEVRSKRETVRHQSKSILEAALQKQVEVGKLAATNIPDIAEILAISIERHAYSKALDEIQYNQVLSNSLSKLTQNAEGSQGLVDRAEEKRREKLAKGRRSVSCTEQPPSPRISSSGQLPLAQDVSNGSATPAASEDGDTRLQA